MGVCNSVSESESNSSIGPSVSIFGLRDVKVMSDCNQGDATPRKIVRDLLE
jgi:hypothetical protein